MKTSYTFILTSLFSVITICCKSQISHGGLPYSFWNGGILTKDVPLELMPKVDVDKLIAEDSENENVEVTPWRFGWNNYTDLDPSNSGIWDILPNGDRLWRLGVKCPGALSINLTFDKFYLPPGAAFYEYNNDRSQVIGAFTDINNRNDSVFATTLVKGEVLYMEYSEPHGSSFHGKIHLYRVTHGYRDLYSFVRSRWFGDSDTCNNNVHCPKAAEWQDQARSVCMIISNGSYLCSGALVNNTDQDGTPYILTAAHCYYDCSSWVFWFNWESPTCENPPSDPGYNSISGASLVSMDGVSFSDFCLVKLSSVPPPDFNVYYSGWNRIRTPALTATGIHHPRGDIKKISYSNQPLYDSTFWAWAVTWDDGIVEPGSSGSPIYDQHRLIVGNLHGGIDYCGQYVNMALYSKFSVAWDSGGTPQTRLKEWLDPAGTQVDTLPGWDPNTQAISRIITPSVKIFPNPGTGEFSIINENGMPGIIDLKISDMQGRIIMEKSFNNMKKYVADLSSIEDGIYLVLLRNGKDCFVRKLVICRK